MKKYSFIKLLLAVLFACTSSLTFAFGGKAEDTKTTVIGHIKYYGNEPFDFAGFETDDGLLYTIKVEENANFTMEDITYNQGKRLALSGIIDSSHKNGLNVLKDGIFVVSEWKEL